MFNQSTMRFVILAAPRSGSNMLCSLLNSHDSILCHHELYNPVDIFYALHLRNTGFSLAKNMSQRDDSPMSFLNRVWENTMDNNCVGFKMTHKQNSQVYYELLKDKNIKKIILKRKNQVKVHVSKRVAEKSGIWESYGNTDQPHPGKVEVELADLYDDISFNEAFYNEMFSIVNSSNQKHLCIEYESLQLKNTQNAILDFLEVHHQELTTISRKQNPTDLRQLVSNYSTLFGQCNDEVIKAQLSDNSQ